VSAAELRRTAFAAHELPPPAATTTIALGIPHELAGRDNCLMCHEAGIGGTLLTLLAAPMTYVLLPAINQRGNHF